MVIITKERLRKMITRSGKFYSRGKNQKRWHDDGNDDDGLIFFWRKMKSMIYIEKKHLIRNGENGAYKIANAESMDFKTESFIGREKKCLSGNPIGQSLE